jgi:hypothetical protein
MLSTKTAFLAIVCSILAIFIYAIIKYIIIKESVLKHNEFLYSPFSSLFGGFR